MPSTPKRATRVILLRHGASTFNVEGRYQGCCNESLLTQEGRRSARMSGERLEREGIDVMVASPLQRAVETAREVRSVLEQGGLGVPLVTDDRLREVDLPAWEGLRYKEVEREFPAQLSAWRLNPSELRMTLPSGKDAFPVRNLYRRAKSFWEDLIAAYTGKTVLLVTHGGTGRAMVTSALGLGVDHFHRVQQSNCGISCLTLSGSLKPPKLELLNDTAHLAKALPKLKEGRTGVRLLLITADSDNAEDYLELARVLDGIAIDRMLVLDSVCPAALSVSSNRPGMELTSKWWLERSLQGILEAAIPAQPLSQVVVLARASVGRQLLECCLSLPQGAGRYLRLKRVGVNAVHSPGQGLPPILQGMNLFGRKNHLTGRKV